MPPDLYAHVKLLASYCTGSWEGCAGEDNQLVRDEVMVGYDGRTNILLTVC